jgi:hypothetical protein
MSGAGSIKTGASTPIPMKLCERFATPKESLQGASLRMLDAEVTAYTNDFAIFIFEFLLPLVMMSCWLDG